MLTAYYDLATSPASYDIVSFLSEIEAERIRRDESQLNIIILPGPVGGFRRDNLWPREITVRRLMLEQIALPMAHLLPSATVEVANDRPTQPVANSVGFGVSLYGLAVHVKALKDGSRPLRPLVEPRQKEKLITITLREADHWPERNSDFAQWIRAAEELSCLGYNIVFVRDTRKCAEPIALFPINVEAAVDLKARAALYRSALCNLFVSNGPAWFAIALDAPVLMFKPTIAGHLHVFTESYFQQCGVTPGQQLPSSPDYQRLVWCDDRADLIVAECQKFLKYCNKR
jgi:hypothetical protein